MAQCFVTYIYGLPDMTPSVTVHVAFPYRFVAKHLYVSACSTFTFGICCGEQNDVKSYSLLRDQSLYYINGVTLYVTSRVCSLDLWSYLVLYNSGSDVSPLLPVHFTVGAGSPLTTALKMATLPAVKKVKLALYLNVICWSSVTTSDASR